MSRVFEKDNGSWIEFNEFLEKKEKEELDVFLGVWIYWYILYRRIVGCVV